MNNYKKTNAFLIIFTLGIAVFFGILSFTSTQAEVEETSKINAYLAEFENLNQYQKKDTITPNVITYSQLKNFNENDDYLHNRKDISKSVTTYSKSGITLLTKKKYDVSKNVTTYSNLKRTGTEQKKQSLSNRVTTYSALKKELKTDKKQKVAIKSKNKPKQKAILKKTKTEPLKKENKTLVKVQKSKVKKITNPKKTLKTSSKKVIARNKKPVQIKKENRIQQPKKNKKSFVKPTIKKSTTISQTPIKYKKHKSTETLHYNKKELNTATNINLIESAPVYPSCQNKTTEDDKKSCLLTNVSRFVLDNFNNSVGKKAGLKKGFYEIRVLFIIDENGISKTYKVLGNKYSPIIKNEIKRIINHLPKMIPGKSNGKKVPVKYSVKVLFEVK